MNILLPDRYKRRAQRLAKHLRQLPEFDVIGVDGEKAALIAMAKGLTRMEEDLGISDANENRRDQAAPEA